ncbi:MAG: hypothetical protein QM811_29365 [Pirellulales bacterium]
MPQHGPKRAPDGDGENQRHDERGGGASKRLKKIQKEIGHKKNKKDKNERHGIEIAEKGLSRSTFRTSPLLFVSFCFS